MKFDLGGLACIKHMLVNPDEPLIEGLPASDIFLPFN